MLVIGMSRSPVIAIVGSAGDLEPAISHARMLGRLIAEKIGFFSPAAAMPA